MALTLTMALVIKTSDACEAQNTDYEPYGILSDINEETLHLLGTRWEMGLGYIIRDDK